MGKRILCILLAVLFVFAICGCKSLRNELEKKIKDGIHDKIKDVAEEIKQGIGDFSLGGLGDFSLGNLGDLSLGDLESLLSGKELPSEAQEGGSHFVDGASLLNGSQSSTVEKLLQTLSYDSACWIAVYTANKAGVDFEAEAYGIAEELKNAGNQAVVLLYVDVAGRNYRVETVGWATGHFDSETQERLDGSFRSLLSEGEYYQAFCTFATQTAAILGEGKG